MDLGLKGAKVLVGKRKAAAIVTISSVSGREADFASGSYGTFKPCQFDVAWQYLFRGVSSSLAQARWDLSAASCCGGGR
jgi:hypothetical protein